MSCEDTIEQDGISIADSKPQSNRLTHSCHSSGCPPASKGRLSPCEQHLRQKHRNPPLVSISVGVSLYVYRSHLIITSKIGRASWRRARVGGEPAHGQAAHGWWSWDQTPGLWTLVPLGSMSQGSPKREEWASGNAWPRTRSVSFFTKQCLVGIE